MSETIFYLDGAVIHFMPGDTIVGAAKRGGVVIDTLCGNGEFPDCSYCMVCAVYDQTKQKMIPACTTLAQAGMKLEQMSALVLAFRRRALTLILSDHLGDCLAPCVRACPYHFDLPGMLAGQTMTERPDCQNCDARCEKACRKKLLDHQGVAIRSYVEQHWGHLPVAKPRDPGFCHALRFGKADLPVLKELPCLPDNGCLQCQCLAERDCRLRSLAQKFGLESSGASPQTGVSLQKYEAKHLIFEPNKCILCGRCVAEDPESGLCYRGRGETLNVFAPIGQDILQVLNQLDAAIADCCPVGALTKR